MPPAVELRSVSKSYGGSRVVDEVSLAIARGEFFSLLGSSGCGKSTTLRLVAGFEQPDGGAILFNGEPASVKEPAYARRVNMVFQNYALFPHLTVAENVAFGLKMAGMARADRERRTKEMLAVVQLEGLDARMPSQLSGGQQQRVALARAMATEPEVVLLDEPLGALDLKLRREMQVELKRIQQARGLTFIYVTHDQEEALSMSDRLCVMHGGRAMQTGTPREIYLQPASRFVAEFMGENNVLRDGAGKWIAVRPEEIHWGVAENAEHVRAQGTVQECVYQGAGFLLHLRLSDGRTLRVHRASSAGALEPGSVVEVWWPQSAEHVLMS